ncbi:MAG: MarR family winged helix-turn-helix transcriptional regulator [Alphaproteobacteria bacterium]|nr:MarR family winged helix-turn-helix transcriptional regulator [Alphaproteobacteria bacterium]
MSALPMDPADDAGLACTCAAVRVAARRLTQFYDDALRDTGLKVTQYALMANIARMDRPSVTDLADQVSMDRTTLTRNLAPLKRAGLVELEPGPDKRTRSVVLTTDGRRRLDAARAYWRTAEMELRQRAGSDITAALHTALDRTVGATAGQRDR